MCSGHWTPKLALAGLPVNGAGPDLEQDGRGGELALGVVELGLPTTRISGPIGPKF